MSWKNHIAGPRKRQEYSTEQHQCSDGKCRDFRVLRVLDLPGQVTCTPAPYIKLKMMNGMWLEIPRIHPMQLRHLDEAHIQQATGITNTRKLGPDVYVEMPCCS